MKTITAKRIDAVIRGLDEKTDSVIRYLLDLFGEEQPALCDYIHKADDNLTRDEIDLLVTTALMGWYIVRETLGCPKGVDVDLIDERLEENIDLFEEEYRERSAGGGGSPLALLSEFNGQRELMGFLASLIINRPDDYSGTIRAEATLPMVMHVKTVVDCLTAEEEDAAGEGEYSDKDFEKARKSVKGLFESYKKSAAFMKLGHGEKEEAEFAVTAFGEMMYTYFLRQPEEWKPGDAKKCCLAVMPGKIMADRGFFMSVEPVLRSFLTFCAESGAVPAGGRIAAGLAGIGDAIVEHSENPALWGPGKAVLKDAEADGVNVSSRDELEKYMKGRIGRPAAKQGSTAPGRNDPCPCGSGKKYKKCCG